MVGSRFWFNIERFCVNKAVNKWYIIRSKGIKRIHWLDSDACGLLITKSSFLLPILIISHYLTTFELIYQKSRSFRKSLLLSHSHSLIHLLSFFVGPTFETNFILTLSTWIHIGFRKLLLTHSLTYSSPSSFYWPNQH